MIQVRPRRIHPLTPDIFSAVEHIIQYLNAQMGHADLVHVRETHSKAYLHLTNVLNYRIHLIPNVSGRLFDF